MAFAATGLTAQTNMIGWLRGVDREQPGCCAGYSG